MFDRELIGESLLEDFDEGMALARGEFVPTSGYKKVEAVFKLFSRTVRQDSSATQELALGEYYKRRDALNLKLIKSSGEQIPTGFIHILDFTDDPEIKTIEIETQILDRRLL